MAEKDNGLEGSLVLEKLAAIGKAEAFLDAIDSDDFARAEAIMKQANIDGKTIALVLQQMQEAAGEH